MYRLIDLENYDLREIQTRVQLHQLKSDRLDSLRYRAQKVEEFIETVRTTIDGCSALWDCTQGENYRLLFLSDELRSETGDAAPIGRVDGIDLLLDCDYFYNKIKKLSRKDIRFQHKSQPAYY